MPLSIVLIDPTTAAVIARQADTILAAAAVELDADLLPYVAAPARLAGIRECTTAIALAAELVWAHESTSPADASLHFAASQLKLWHLSRLDQILSRGTNNQ